MSVNITLNGEYIKSCPRHYLLCDQERLKKENENERRKLRIQQVRAASKDMARKVRNNVEMEKEKQMRKIEEIKAKEMEMWRQNILEEKEGNYKSAIFQIGTAHRAAKRENEKQAKVKINTKPRTPKVITRKGPTIHKGKENKLKNANAQTEITGDFCPEAPQIRKTTSFAIDSSISDSDDNSAMQQSICSSSLSDSNLLNTSDTTSSNLIELRELPTKLKERPSKVNQKVLQPRSRSKSPYKKFDAVSKKLANSDSALKAQDPKTVSPIKFTKSEDKKMKSDEKLQDEEIRSRPTDTRKRFTQITDFIRQQEGTESDAIPSQSQRVHLQKSPNKSKSPVSKRSHQTQVSICSPIKSKSSTTIRPLGEQRIDSSASKLSAGTSGRVQFYDHNNRFQKEYNQPTSIVQMHNVFCDGTEMNATQQAALARKLQEAREEEIEKLRKKTDDRCQKAIEREQVRRACEDLTAKLDALSKQRPLLPSDNYQYSSVRLGQIATEREAKLNSAVENILRRPAVITCPPINRQQTNAASAPSAPEINELNVGSAENDVSSLNSSDSCCSILLGYVNGQTKQIADDIKKYNNQTGETGKMKVEKLQDLLSRINRLRETLLTEIAKFTSSNSSDKEMVEKLMNSINQFRKERESILIENNVDDITKRENALKKKEAILEQKLREFYKTQKAVRKKATSAEEKIDRKHVTEKQEETCNVPQEKLKEAVSRKADATQGTSDKDHSEKNVPSSKADCNVHKKKTHKECARESENVEPSKESKPFRAEEKTRTTEIINSEEESDDSSEEYVKHKELIIDKKPLEIVIKVRGSKKTKTTFRLPSKSPRKLSTLIQSPISTKNRRRISSARSNDSSSTSYRSLPPAIHTGMDDLIIKEPQPKDKMTEADSRRQTMNDTNVKKKRSNLNPLMAHYVQRLLGMSRSSINALGMLSSDIETPSSSIVNTTANISATETEMLASSRLENVQRFIEENYSFINEFEESLRQGNVKEPSLKSAEVAWNKTLKEQKKAASSGKTSEKEQTSTGKNVKRDGNDSEKTSSKSLRDTQKRTVEIETIKQPPGQVDKGTQLTDNCTQRIAELSAMIDKIRQEKQKILETTFSSVSENGPNSTEYMDLPDRRNERSSSKSLEGPLSKSIENLPTQSLGSVPKLDKNNIIGMSRDSGISLSRPITVQEIREGSTDNLQRDQSSTESLSLQSKQAKPPISISRYSPQLVEDIPHELSTIFEVETPATSKMNTSINGQRTEANAQLQDDQLKEIAYKKFPTFEEYARLNQLDMSQFDPEFSMQFEKEFNVFMQFARDGKIADYEKFTSFSQYVAKSSNRGDKEAAEELLESLKMTNLSFKKFPTRKEYLSKIGVSTSDMVDSQSLEYIDESRNSTTTNSSSESLMNIENELKQRKILTKPFRQNAPPTANTSSTSAGPRGYTLETNTYHNEISGIMQLTSAATSTDDQSQNLEQDLQMLGINWPSAMKKKTMQTQALSSTSSSLEQASPRTKRLRSKTLEASQIKESRERTIATEEGGRQLNIREFLTRELLKRTTNSSSIPFSDDSVASSILRSIIGSISSSPAAVDAAPTLERHKTSTPMASHSTSISRKSATKSRGSGSSQLFSGESLLSSVHFHNHSGDVHKGAQKSASSEPMKKPL